MNAASFISSAVVDRLGWVLIHSLWQGTAVAGLLAIVFLFSRRRSPQLRDLCALGSLLAIVGLMLATYAILAPPVPAAGPVAATRPGLTRMAQPHSEPVFSQTPSVPAPTAATGLSTLTWSKWLEPFMPWLVGLWACGVLALSTWHAGGWVAAQRLRVLGVSPVCNELKELLARLQLRLGVRRAVALLQSCRVESPVALGLLRPVILMPAAILAGLSVSQLEAILAHELAHIRRWDYLVNLVQTAVETLLFYHPAVWWISRRIRLEREHCCDDVAVGICGSPARYAESLSAVEELRAAVPRLALAAGGSGGSELAWRIRRLLGVGGDRARHAGWWLVMVGVITAALGLTVASGRDTGDADAHYRRGLACQEKGDYDKAIVEFTEAIRLDPKDADAYHNRGLAYGKKGEHDNAIADFNEAIHLDPKDAGAYYNRGVSYQKKGDRDEAIADFTEAIRLDPKNADGYYGRGWAHAEKGAWDEAIADYTGVIRLDPKNADAYAGRGYAYAMKGDQQKAIADYTEAIRLNPKYADAYCDRGCAHGEKQEWDMAIADYTEAIRLDPKDAYAYAGRGYAYGMTGDQDGAIADYTEAIRLSPKDADAHFGRGYAYAMKDEQGNAIADYTEAIRLSPNNADAYCDRGFAYQMTGDLDKAVADFTEAIRLNPKDATFYRSRSSAYEKLGQQEKAGADAAEAERLDPSVGWLPVYSCIASDSALGQELQLSPQQRKKLGELAAKYPAQGQEFVNDLVEQALKLPADQRTAWLAKQPRQDAQSRRKAAGKAVEEILSRQQVEACKKWEFPDLAYAMLRHPEFLTLIGATPEQREQLAEIQRQRERQRQAQDKRRGEQMLAVLSPQQQAKLRAEIQRSEDAAANNTTTITGGTIELGDPFETGAPGPSDEFPDIGWGVPAYGELTSGATRKQLGFTAAQESAWQEITANERKERGRTPEGSEQWKRRRSEFCRQVEGLLTPQQATALKETRLRGWLDVLAQDPELMKKLAITEGQKVRLRRVSAAGGEGSTAAERDAKQKSLALLTAAQRQKLREELDRRGAW